MHRRMCVLLLQGKEFSPDQIRLTIWGRNSLLFSWATGLGRIGPSGSPPSAYSEDAVGSFVKYGNSDDSLNNVVVGKSGANETIDSLGEGTFSIKYGSPSTRVVYSYQYGIESGEIEGQGSVYQSPILHHIVVEGLNPGNTYYYQVGSVVHGFSETLSFKMPSNEYPISIGVSADWGVTYNATNAMRRLSNEDSMDMLLIPGDLVYADSFLGNGSYRGNKYPKADTYTSYQPYWDIFGRMIQPFASRVPSLAVGGNHEFESLVLRKNLSNLSFNSRYPMPRSRDEINTGANDIQGYWDQSLFPGYTKYFAPEISDSVVTNNTWFSADNGPVHIVGLNNYVPPGDNASMYRWFEEDLQSIDRSVTKWIIVMFHAPFYSTMNGHYKGNQLFQQYFEPLFYKYKVDFVFSGHAHSYDRSTPVFDFNPNTCGPVHVMVGSGGAPLDDVYVDQRPDGSGPVDFCFNISLWKPAKYQANYVAGPYLMESALPMCYASQAPWSDFRSNNFGYGVLNILNDTHAEWKWNSNNSPPDVYIDQVMLAKNDVHASFDSSHNAECNSKVVQGIYPSVNSNAKPIDIE